MPPHNNNLEEVADAALHKKFLQILNSQGINDEVEKITFSEPSSLKGEHLASASVYVLVQFKNRSKVSMNFFMKKFTDNPGHTAFMKEMRIMEKETNFFMEFLPFAKEFCKKFKGCENIIDFFPKCFYGDSEIIVMENLVLDSTFVMLPVKQLQDLHTAKLVLSNLAKFHAVTYAVIEDMGIDNFLQKFELITLDVMVDVKNDKVNPMITKMLDNSITLSSKILKKNPVEGWEEAINMLSGYIGKIKKVFIDACTVNVTDRLKVVNHGDCWNNNMLFKVNADGGNVYEQVFVDLQATRVNSPNVDIGYFLFTSVKPEIRRNQLQELLQHYFETFEQTLTLLNKTSLVNFEEFFSDFKRRVSIGFFFGLAMIIARRGALKNVDTEKMGDDPDALAEIFDQGLSDWINDNPNQTEEIAAEIVANINEFIYITSE